ncbi:pectinesterase family protein [Paenibacillus sp. RC67]|uniref:pectinesterase family protein n=1 Tax=Paenibacillus sp. RC67 TaxID=3039392 RepID=UPI0024AC8913|nr:pectinesterase family protein [Paenibacillus sp. RC67]
MKKGTMVKTLRIMLCFLLLASYIPILGIPSAEAASLPTGWSSLSYNGSTGTNTYDKATGKLTVTSTASNGITNQTATAEQFQYAFTPISGDFTLIAKLTNYPYVSGAQAGVLVRSTLDQGSSFVYSYYYGTGNKFQPYVTTKSVAGGSASNSGYKVSSVDVTYDTPPSYMRIRKQWNGTKADVYFDMGTSDGMNITWTNINGKSITDVTATQAVNVGFAVGKAATASFDSITLLNSYNAASTTAVSSLTASLPVSLEAPTLSGTAGDNKVTLNWDAVTDAVYYNVGRSTASGGPYTKLNSGPVNGLSYTDSAVTNGQTYKYVVTAANSVSTSVYSNEVSITPTATTAPAGPAAPTNAAASAGNKQMTLSWNSVSGATSYNVKQSAAAGGPYTLITNVTTGTSFTHTGLTNGTTYYYVISAVNAAGEGANSSEVSGKPGVFFINDNFESSTLGDTPAGYVSIANAGDEKINNVTVINNSNLTNKYYSPSEVAPANNKSATVTGNSTNVLWINDNADSGRRGGFTNSFTPVSGKSGLTAELSFMQPKVIGDSYPLELIDSSGKTVLSFSVTNLNVFETVNSNNTVNWYNLKFVADTGTNTVDVYFNGVYRGNFKFSTQDTNIAKIQSRTAGSSTGSMYIDNVKVYQQAAVTPQNLTTAGANQKVILSWNAASGVDSYNVYRSAAVGGPYTRVAANVTSPTYTDTTGLVNKNNYYYVVTGVNANGESDKSNEAYGYPNDVKPPAIAPTFGQIDIRDSQITLNWSSVQGIDGDKKPVDSTYTLLRSTHPEGPFITVAQKLTGTTYLDKNLTNDTQYYYQVIAANMGGSSPSSKLLKVAPAAPLETPTLLSAVPGNNQVDLSWTSVTDATYYSVKRSTVNGGPYTTVKDVNGVSFTDANVTNDKTYYYAVVASHVVDEQLAQESMISNQLKVTPYAAVAGAPAVPTGLKALAAEGSASLSWDKVAGATGYTVKRATTSGGPYTTLTSTNQTMYEDKSVTNGTTYYYVVSASNASGAGPLTDEITVLPAKVLTVDQAATSASSGFGAKLFNTIQSAVNVVPTSNTERTVIYIKAGTYTEKLTVDRPYVSLVGDGIDKTIIVYGDYAGTSSTTGKPGHTGNTFLSQTVKVTGDNFTAAQLTIENSSGPRSAVAQAVALSLYSDKASFESVKLKGYQDTLYNGLNGSNKGRHYFHNSIIQGDVDFIFGEAPAVVMDNVKMVLVSNSGGGGHITAGAQKNVTDKGYVFFNSQIVDDASASGTYDLGRGWKDYARVSFINTLIDSKKFLNEGWVAACAGSCITNYFSEYNSYGTGANPSARKLSTQLTGQEASLTIPQIFTDWDPSIPVIMPNVNYSPAVSVTSSNFDKNSVNQADIHVTLQLNGDVLKSITNGATVLAASDYKVTGNVVTISKVYLAGLQEGITTLSFNFGTTSIPVTINVINTDTTSDLGKQVLAVNDGWGSFTTGTTGGSKASAANIFTVTKRSELIKALGGNNSSNASNATPKIIYVKGTVDMNVDDNDNPVGMDYYKDPAYDLQAYLAAYDPAVWGVRVPSGALETARAVSETNQGNKIKINVGANTTIVGLSGSNAKILGGNLMIQNVDNVIVRNIDFQNAFDYFPQWDPTDGTTGNWNSAFDNITVKNAQHVWIDHNTFSDGNNRDDYNIKYFGRQYQQHDGALDITNSSDLITVSYNYFHDHDKNTLVGGSDSYTDDRGKERITFHHNYYQNVTQRAPRVRFGQVHLYNNYYEGTLNNANYPFLYAIGVGLESHIVAQNNYFMQDEGTTPESLIQVSAGGTEFTDTGSILNGVAVNIAQSKGGLSPVNWTPTLFTKVDKTADVPSIVKSQAGAENTLPVQVAPPAAPSDLIATAGIGQVSLQWSSVTEATYYNVKRSTIKGGAYTTIATNVTGTSYTDTGLTNGTTYYYVVSAANAGGESANTQEVNATPTAPVTPVQPPAAPSGLITTAGIGQVSLQWSSVTEAVYYNVKRSTTKGGAYTTIATNVTGTSYTDTGLTNGTTYYYVVSAANAGGESANTQEVNATPTAPVNPVQQPAAPSGLIATPAIGQVSLQWNSVTEATYYNVKRSTTKGGAYTTIATNVTGIGYTDMGLTNFTTYYYVVIAVNKGGESSNSAEVSATPYYTQSGGSRGSSTSGVTTPTVTVEPAKDGSLIINLQSVSEKTADGKAAAKATLEGAALTQALDMLKASGGAAEPRISIEVKGNNEAIGKLEIPSQSIADLISKAPKAIISLKYGGASYDLPLKAIDLAALASKLGTAAKDVKIIISIEKVSGTTLSSMEAKAKQQGLNPLVPAVDFTVTAADSSGKQVQITDFGTLYITRTLDLVKEPDPKKTTAVLFNPVTGKFSFVPATFSTSSGVSQAKLKRPGNSMYTVVEYSKTFDDLKGHWSQADVDLLASKLVVNGMTDSSFAPQHEITRAEFATLLVRALGLTESTSVKFSDVQASDWFAGAIGAASQAGLVDGFENGTFQPGANITREQMAVMMTRAMGVAGKKADSSQQALSKFSDAPSVSGWAKEAVAQAVNAGIINGVTSDTFVPNDMASRAEAAVMLKRLLQYEQLIN